MRFDRTFPVFLGLLAGFYAGCRTTADAQRQDRAAGSTATAPAAPSIVTTAPAVAAHEASVRPGINKEYQGEIDVAKWVARFEAESREIFQHRDQIMASADVRAGQTVADIGAGTGLFAALFAQKVGPQGKVFAVDIAPAFLEHIAARARESGLHNIQTVLCKEDSVELPPASLDLAFVCDTYHHFEYPQSTLRSIHRALKPDGRMVIIDFERIEGVTPQWILEHVRAGKEQFTAEIRAAGFELVEPARPAEFLKENYFLTFRKAPTSR